MSGRISDSSGKRGFTLVELVAVIVLIAVLAAIILPMLAQPRSGRRPSCANNLKQMGLSLKMYANESTGSVFPRMGYYYSQEVDCDAVDQFGDGTYPVVNPGTKVPLLTLMFSMDDMYPEYLPDVYPLVCPSDLDFHEDDWENPVTNENDFFRHCMQTNRGLNLVDTSYIYISHLIDKCGGDDCTVPYTEFSPVLQAYFADDVAAGASIPDVCAQFGGWFDWIVNAIENDPAGALTLLDGDFDMEIDAAFDVLAACAEQEFVGNGDGNTIYRLREGLVRDYLWDGEDQSRLPISEADVPVMFGDATLSPENFNHIPGGSNVLYLDGHVEFFKYPDEAPVSAGMLWLTQCIGSGK